MEFPDKEEAVRFFTDVKAAIVSYPEAFQDDGLDLKFTNQMLDSLSGEWKILPRLPEPYYEINQDGHIRHKVTQEIIKPTFEVAWGKEVVKLRMDGETYYFDGPPIAEAMFGSEDTAFSRFWNAPQE